MGEPKTNWPVNEAALSWPVTDDPRRRFSQLDEIHHLPEDIDDHRRFLIGDWPR
jgi:hypothetical protein